MYIQTSRCISQSTKVGWVYGHFRPIIISDRKEGKRIQNPPKNKIITPYKHRESSKCYTFMSFAHLVKPLFNSYSILSNDGIHTPRCFSAELQTIPRHFYFKSCRPEQIVSRGRHITHTSNKWNHYPVSNCSNCTRKNRFIIVELSLETIIT